MTELEKPFWLRPPYVILFDLLRVHRLKPWDVNLNHILNSFLAQMNGRGYIDFPASGIALLSSSIIHRLKSEAVLKMEEPPKPPQPRPQDYVPPALPMPIRFEYTSTSISEVLQALEQVLESERLTLLEKKPILTPPAILEHLDEFMMNIEERIEEFYSDLIKKGKGGRSISFLRMAGKRPFLDVVRDFIMILFLAIQGKITLQQDQEFGDIRIRVCGVKPTLAA
jgi:segregation and condensation protein A